jgi:hypothetical protein
VGGQYCRVTNCGQLCLGCGGNGAVTRLARQLKACRLCSVIPGGSRQNGRQCANTPTTETGRTATPSNMCWWLSQCAEAFCWNRDLNVIHYNSRHGHPSVPAGVCCPPPPPAQ